MKSSDVTAGMQFGYWTVLENQRPRHLLVQCICGMVKTARAGNIIRGASTNCGCMAGRHMHGKTRTKEYKVWLEMRRRCSDPSIPNYHLYGGRGIRVCERWELFANFIADMGMRPSSGHSIDRIDNDGNYEPGNCRWADRTTQSWNKRTNRLLTVNGEARCVAEWAKLNGIKAIVIYCRLYRGWPAHMAIDPTIKGRRFSKKKLADLQTTGGKG